MRQCASEDRGAGQTIETLDWSKVVLDFESVLLCSLGCPELSLLL